MALAILPIGFLLGLLLKDARRASWATLFVAIVGLLALSIISASGVDIWWGMEALVLLVGTPVAVLLAHFGARLGTRGDRRHVVRPG